MSLSEESYYNGNGKKVIIHKGIAIIAQIPLFHENTLNPSMGGNGIILNAASQILIKNPKYPISDKSPILPIKKKKKRAKSTFVRGPAREIIPFSLLLITRPRPNEIGRIYTAPGAAKIILPAETKANNKAKPNPKGHILNSAKHLYL